MAKKLTVAVIGCGAIAQGLHLPGYSRCKDIKRLIAVDVDPVRFKDLEGKFPIAATYTDRKEMLKKENPDIVSVCTPNCFHAEIALDALEAGANVLLEKPMTKTMDQARNVLAVAEKTGGKVMIGFTHRFHSRNGKVKELLQQNVIGDPFMIRVRFAHTGPFPGWAKSDWFYNPEMAGGGALLDMGIHAIDICQWMMGPITSVASQMGTLRKNISVDDNALLALTFGDRAMGYIEVGWTSPAGFCGFEIMGDNGAIINDYTSSLRVGHGRISPEHDSVSNLTWEEIDSCASDGGAREMEYFLNTIQQGETPEPGLHAGYTALEVALAAIDSAKTGQRAELPAFALKK